MFALFPFHPGVARFNMQTLTQLSIGLAAAVLCGMTSAQSAPIGEIKGTGWQHTAESLAAAVRQANTVVPAKFNGGTLFVGKFENLPKLSGGKIPVVVFLHGSSGLGLAAIGEWQNWLADLGFASVAPDSFALADHVTYKSPIDKITYERIHAMRGSEIAPMLDALKAQFWVNTNHLILAGTSEGSVPVARYKGTEFAARMLYSWSCETNYFVIEPQNAFEANKPVLNVISSTDPFFSPSNTWLGNPAAKGHCGAALKENKQAAVVLVPDAPHTLLNFPAARHATAGFLASVVKP